MPLIVFVVFQHCQLHQPLSAGAVEDVNRLSVVAVCLVGNNVSSVSLLSTFAFVKQTHDLGDIGNLTGHQRHHGANDQQYQGTGPVSDNNDDCPTYSQWSRCVLFPVMDIEAALTLPTPPQLLRDSVFELWRRTTKEKTSTVANRKVYCACNSDGSVNLKLYLAASTTYNTLPLFVNWISVLTRLAYLFWVFCCVDHDQASSCHCWWSTMAKNERVTKKKVCDQEDKRQSASSQRQKACFFQVLFFINIIYCTYGRISNWRVRQ